MGLARPLIVAGLLTGGLFGCATGAPSRLNSEAPAMEEIIYTLGVWRVHAGREAEFIAAWKDLGVVFASLPAPPTGKGVLIQSTTEPTLFYSFGPWRSLDDVTAMREVPRAQAAIQRLRELCSEATPGAFRVVAESPEAG